MKNTIYPKPRKIKNLKELVEFNAKDYGDKVLYRYKLGKEEFSCSYNQLKHFVDSLGTAFYSLGIMGKNIAVIGDPHPYYMATYYAAANGGGAVIPLDKELGNQALADFMKIADVKAIVYSASFNDRMADIASLADCTEYFIPMIPDDDFTANEKFIPCDDLIKKGEELLEKGENAFTSFEPDEKAMAALLFTSGTTGTSKGVMLSHRNLASCTNACCDSMNFNPNNNFVSVLPMNHSYEVTCGHLALGRIGCTAFLNDSIRNALRNFKNVKPDALILVPLFVETIHKRIWKEIEKKGLTKKVKFGIKLTSFLRHIGIDIRRKVFAEILENFGGNLKTIVCGGAPLSKNLIKDFDSFGIEILEGYGITECSPLLSVNRSGHVKMGSVGTPVLDCEVKIDDEDGSGTGEILAKGPNVMMGYINNPEANASVFTDDGWFRTGDIGHLDKDGYIYITGRKKNIIILSNGKNIFPEELEEHLSHNEIVGECVVIGRENDKNETEITAVIYPNPEISEGKSEEEIYEAVKNAVTSTNDNLPIFKHILNFEIRKEEFEKTTTRKIKRFLVK